MIAQKWLKTTFAESFYFLYVFSFLNLLLLIVFKLNYSIINFL